MTKVKIDTPGATVEVEADGDLAEVADKAVELFHAAGGWPQIRPSSTGFALERRDQPSAQPSSMRLAPHPYPTQGQESA